MAIILMDGFDPYNGVGTGGGLQSKWLTGDSARFGTGTGRFTGQGMTHVTGSANGWIQRSWATGITQGTAHFAWNFTTMVASDAAVNQHMQLSSGNTRTIGIRVTASGAIAIYRASGGPTMHSGTVLATSAASGLILANTWNYFEVEFVLSDTVGRVSVYLNGNATPVVEVTNADTNNAVTSIDTIAFGTTFGSNGNFTTDDLYVTDSATRNGERRIETLYPIADTAQKDFTRSTGTDNYALVDEAQVSTTDYVQSNTVNATDRYLIGDLTGNPTAIDAVQVSAFATKTDAGQRSLALQVKSGATTSDGTATSITASYTKIERLLATNPNTGTAWTTATVNALEAGPKIAS